MKDEQQSLNDLSIDELTDTLFIALWQRQATKMGWCKWGTWKRVVRYHLPGVAERRHRVVWDKLMQRGHLLALKLTPGHHSSYLFTQLAIPLDDEDARAEATRYYRWYKNWSQ